MGSNTAAVVLNSPYNPTGRVFDERSIGDAGRGRIRVSFANSTDRIEAGPDVLAALVREEVEG